MWRRSSTDILSSNISDPLPKKSDNPSEKVIKTSRNLDETGKVLITNTDMIVKKGNTYMLKKPNVGKEVITPLIAKKNIETVHKTKK